MRPKTVTNLPFSLYLREQTRRSHGLAENAAFIRGFLRGVIDPGTYLQLLTDLLIVYRAMEDVVPNCREQFSAVGHVYFPELFRVPAIEADQAFFQDLAQVAELPSPSPAAEAYRDSVYQIAEYAPELLVAHVYTRYLGDLAGGQVLASVLRRSLRLEEGRGTEFYRFNQIASSSAFRAVFRERLDTLPVTRAVQEAIVAEANRVFQLNLSLFEQFDGSALRTALRVMRPRALDASRAA